MFELNNKRLVVQSVSDQTMNLLMDRRLVTISFCKTETIGVKDTIQELKEAAINNEFDILLVFMFDRIGRIEYETPFVVEWFANNGIEVWSTR